MTPYQAVVAWLERIKTKQELLDGFPICPFAKTIPNVIVIDKLDENVVTPATELTVYVEETKTTDFENLNALCKMLNNIYSDHIFLPDHPDQKNYIQGIETGNQHYPLILVQLKNELLPARQKLHSTKYYSFWDKDYLIEIKSYGN